MVPMQSVLPATVRALLRHGPMTQEKLEFAWTAAVGPAIARATRVRWQEDDGTVVVEASDETWRRELRRSLPEMTGRLVELVGRGVLASVRLAGPERPGRP